MTKIFCIYVGFIVLLLGFFGSKSEELSASNPQRGTEERIGLFSSIQDYAITLIFKTLQVKNAFGCVLACLTETTCQSVNFGTSGDPEHLCELSKNSLDSRPFCKEPRPGYIHYYFVQTTPVSSDDPCIRVPCKNGATCEPVFNNKQGFRCKCGAFTKGQYCQLWTVNVSSCQDIFSKTSYRTAMAYTFLIENKQTDIYCHLSSNICGSRGWTLAMKIDGSKQTFAADSALWSNKRSYGLSAGQTGFDSHETKMPSYWAMPFHSLCVGMKVGNNLNWATILFGATSLYDVIGDGTLHRFFLLKDKWKSLINGSSLQNKCNTQGFNVRVQNASFSYLRIGVIGKEDFRGCELPDSAIGFGLPWRGSTCGNHCRGTCKNGEKNTTAFGYILIK